MWFLGSKRNKLLLGGLCIAGMLMLLILPCATSKVFGQFPTVSIPTVTSSPRGAYVIGLNLTGSEYEPVNIRSGPGTIYKNIGVLLVGEEARALGQYGDWIQIEYIGADQDVAWVYAPWVNLIDGPVPRIEPPPTVTPAITKTIDPTMAAQFIQSDQATRLPTFTEPPPLLIPTYQTETGATAPGGIPLGLVIVILAGLGLFLTLIAVLRRG